MKRLAMCLVLLCSCFADPELDNGIIVPGCDGPPSDPHRVCEGDNGGGGGGGTGGGGGGSSGGGTGGGLPGGTACGYCPAGQQCYSHDRHCAPPPGTRCYSPTQPPNTNCWINSTGYCACYVNPGPVGLTSQEDTDAMDQSE